jgi:MarR-like DNA-binding transcriptional regulator SgrR of sgrS sRNA
METLLKNISAIIPDEKIDRELSFPCHVLEITLERPFPLFVSLLATPWTAIIPNNFSGKSEEVFFTNPIGTGPFIIKGPLNLLHESCNFRFT